MFGPTVTSGKVRYARAFCADGSEDTRFDEIERKLRDCLTDVVAAFSPPASERRSKTKSLRPSDTLPHARPPIQTSLSPSFQSSPKIRGSDSEFQGNTPAKKAPTAVVLNIPRVPVIPRNDDVDRLLSAVTTAKPKGPSRPLSARTHSSGVKTASSKSPATVSSTTRRCSDSRLPPSKPSLASPNFSTMLLSRRVFKAEDPEESRNPVASRKLRPSSAPSFGGRVVRENSPAAGIPEINGGFVSQHLVDPASLDTQSSLPPPTPPMIVTSLPVNDGWVTVTKRPRKESRDTISEDAKETDPPKHNETRTPSPQRIPVPVISLNDNVFTTTRREMTATIAFAKPRRVHSTGTTLPHKEGERPASVVKLGTRHGRPKHVCRIDVGSDAVAKMLESGHPRNQSNTHRASGGILLMPMDKDNETIISQARKKAVFSLLLPPSSRQNAGLYK